MVKSQVSNLDILLSLPHQAAISTSELAHAQDLNPTDLNLSQAFTTMCSIKGKGDLTKTSMPITSPAFHELDLHPIYLSLLLIT